jgi:hypothetical protein
MTSSMGLTVGTCTSFSEDCDPQPMEVASNETICPTTFSRLGNQQLLFTRVGTSSMRQP